ncbi:NlpC/P60 family protein [Desulfovibrio sp. TomC]|uniref:NlpC/P60 family protein n=1 Tax=Desulfovibrio sp. TomC TaxID=1562888 RepID=UPI0005741469|nr:NlpC/P60 family protein [Desulfovibrio sp. TomC]KHK00512.1 hypothetical protein NY78_4073 [Desulfovibrio sp. TomC]
MNVFPPRDADPFNRLRPALALALALLVSVSAPSGAFAQQAHYSPYVSPYSVNYSCSQNSLTFDFNTSPRNDYTQASNTPFAQWYDQNNYPVHNPNNNNTTSASWGPWPANYPWVTVPSGLSSPCDAVTWKRERVLRVAQEYIGYNYQHHHIPDFNPYASKPAWPASNPAVLVNYPTPGIDCSDFSSWNYNFGLGIVLSTAVPEQGLTTTPVYYGQGGSTVTPVAVVPSGAGLTYQQLCDTLRVGDLLYINNEQGTVSHVIMWLGLKGQDANNQDDWLVIDSHDNSPAVVDSNNVTIPPGVHIRPFRQNEWYFTSFDHALRIIPDVVAPGSITLLLENNQ